MRCCQSVHYTHGNSNICSYITENFDVNETICVFLDMPPGNLDIADIYGDLSACAQSYHSLFILPLVCMEYHFLSFVKEFPHLISVESWVNSCLSFGSASATIPPIIDVDNETELRRYAAFERFCKLVARKALCNACGSAFCPRTKANSAHFIARTVCVQLIW